MAQTINQQTVDDEINVLANFDLLFNSTFANVDSSIREGVVEFERVNSLLVELKKKLYTFIRKEQHLVEKIKKIREEHENDEGEFGGYDSGFDSDCGWFEYGTCPSVKAMRKLAKTSANIRDIRDKINECYIQLTNVHTEIQTKVTPYVQVIRSAHSITDGMSHESKQIAEAVFCWGKIGSGICTHHQRGKCKFGIKCRKAHIPIIQGKSRLNYSAYTSPSLYI